MRLKICCNLDSFPSCKEYVKGVQFVLGLASSFQRYVTDDGSIPGKGVGKRNCKCGNHGHMLVFVVGNNRVFEELEGNFVVSLKLITYHLL